MFAKIEKLAFSLWTLSIGHTRRGSDHKNVVIVYKRALFVQKIESCPFINR